MKRYTFYDRDFFHDDIEQDFTPIHYRILMRCCFKYAETFSLVSWHENTAYEKALERYQVPKPNNIKLEQLENLKEVPYVIEPSSRELITKLSENKEDDFCRSGELIDSFNCDLRYTRVVPKFYKACAETFRLLLEMADSVFQLQYNGEFQNPEDLAFFRDDGTILFTSCVHEGECSLFPKTDENISEVLAQGNWILTEE